MSSSPKLSIVVPVYNEAGIITQVIADLKSESLDAEIIVVDDGSTDKTYDLVKTQGVRLIRHLHNKGYGAALKTGIRNAQADLVCIMDADGQHNAKDVARLLQQMQEGYDMVVGARNAQSHFPFFRRLGKSVLKIVANYLAERKIPDLNSGFRIFKKGVTLKFMHIFPNGFSFTTTQTLAFIKEGYEVGYLPITAGRRRRGRSTVKPLYDGAQTFLLIIRIVALFDPLKVFLPSSLFLFLSGMFYFIVWTVLYRDIPEVSLILMFFGVSVFLFGILADQISNLRRQSKE